MFAIYQMKENIFLYFLQDACSTVPANPSTVDPAFWLRTTWTSWVPLTIILCHLPLMLKDIFNVK